ncbi:HNH endonuclease [Marmoricola endophyticus]|uniref:HNH endonuclease n=1 Tax=Marmoricola endophyticus TaxID=2040280 RepID=A0A917BLK1_9ACTN|nr:DUF222 domain-containing protein [Marmoricola endophyticus]GGF48359.1 HNH endonuclease [Marmoricola endophyticus]
MVELVETFAHLATLTGADLTDPERIDQIGLLEQIKSAASAAQARITVAFDASQRSLAAARGVPAAKQGQGVADQVALARRESPHRGSTHLGLARALVGEMPHTLAALTAGETSEWRATVMVRETAALSVEHRAVAAEARSAGYRLDPQSLITRIKRAESDRCVTVRPAPETMSYVTGTLPVAQGVAVYAALRRQAESARSAGDPRSMGQLMADLLVARVTGLPDDGDGVKPPVEVHLVMTDRTLLGDSDEPAEVVGGEPLPAWLARRVVSEAHRAWLRRLWTSPDSKDLVATDSRRREFTGQLRQLLVVRDRFCRTPYCGAPIRHADHIEPHAASGETSAANGEGPCERCNYTRQVIGWRALAETAADGGRHRVTLATPTGHTYVSEPSKPPGAGPPMGIDLVVGVRSVEYAA